MQWNNNNWEEQHFWMQQIYRLIPNANIAFGGTVHARAKLNEYHSMVEDETG